MKPKLSPCPICAERMPETFLVCVPCWKEVPFAMKAEYWTRMGRERAARTDGCYDHGSELKAYEAAGKAILGHLKQFSSAIA